MLPTIIAYGCKSMLIAEPSCFIGFGHSQWLDPLGLWISLPGGMHPLVVVFAQAKWFRIWCEMLQTLRLQSGKAPFGDMGGAEACCMKTSFCP